MGGSASGRYRTRTRGCVESTVRVDLRKLNASGLLREGRSGALTMTWGTGDVVRVEADFTDERERHLKISLNGSDVATRVRVDALPMRYGGFRYYARCPQTYRRCEVLPIIRGKVACRQHHRLSYACQHRDPLTSTHRAIDRWAGRLFGARRKNRERQQARLEAANDRLAQRVASFDCAILRKYRRLIA